jgi:hypothetical protein
LTLFQTFIKFTCREFYKFVKWHKYRDGASAHKIFQGVALGWGIEGFQPSFANTQIPKLIKTLFTHSCLFFGVRELATLGYTLFFLTKQPS